MWSAEHSLGSGAHRLLYSLACPPRPQRWYKLQVLDLPQNTHQDFWTLWSVIKASVCLLLEPKPIQPMQKRHRQY